LYIGRPSRRGLKRFGLFFGQQRQKNRAFCGIVFAFDEISVTRDVLSLDERRCRAVHGAPSQSRETTAGSRGRRKRDALKLPPWGTGHAGGSKCALNGPWAFATGPFFTTAPLFPGSRAICTIPDIADRSAVLSFGPEWGKIPLCPTPDASLVSATDNAHHQNVIAHDAGNAVWRHESASRG